MLKKEGIRYYQEGNFPKADSIFRTCIIFAEVEKDWRSVGQCLNNLASVQFQLGQFAQGIFNYEKAMEVYKSHHLDTLLGESYLNLGLAYKKQAIYDSATANFYRGINLLEKLNVPTSLMRGYNMLGNTMRETGSLKAAKNSYQRALDLARSEKDETTIAAVFNNLGTVFRKENEIDSAIHYYRLSLELKSGTDQYKRLGNTYFNLGETFLDIQSTDSAKFYLLESMKYRKIANDNFGLAHSFISTIKVFLIRGEIDSISNHLVELHKLVSTISSKDLSLKALEVEKDYMIAVNNYKKANQLDFRIRKLRNEILNRDKQNLISSYEVLHNVLKLKETIVTQSQVLFWAFTVVALLLITGLFLFRERQKKKKAARIIETLFKDMHHRVKNNLSLLNGIITFHRRNLKDDTTKDILKNIGSQVDTINLIHQKLYLQSGEKVGNINLGEYLKELIENVFVSAGISEENSRLEFNFESVHVTAEKVNYIGLIVNEIATNTIKYGKSDDDQWSFFASLKSSENDVEIFLKDQGKGITEKPITGSKSIGMGLIELFSSQLNATIKVWSENGANFILRFKK
ncbi:histidine kinase dimerization/phosphoacceptor domain -containing protein [Fulvivirgaceae bacterium BMA10]|uniref:histidine kinase n=1 Tax=Splendidivirga corallicola TaxID=3051826 RepID=A0ABT8KKM8_9BACT|nr:histidine kinase dimerization/phosphoacceptor domain -containing protein [Fulvivirgaceae bacterium BMA10]